MKEEIAELLPSGDEDRLPLCPEEKPWLVGFVYQFDCQEEMKWCWGFFLFRCEIWTVGSDVASEHNWSFVSPRERSRPQERSLQEHKDLTGFYNVVGCWRSSHWDIFYSLCTHIQLCFSENHGWMEYVSQTVFFFSPPWNCRHRRWTLAHQCKMHKRYFAGLLCRKIVTLQIWHRQRIGVHPNEFSVTVLTKGESHKSSLLCNLMAVFFFLLSGQIEVWWFCV